MNLHPLRSFRFRSLQIGHLALLLPALWIPAAAAGGVTLQDGYYAPVSGSSPRVFHNRFSFSCVGRSAGYCDVFSRKVKLSAEDRELAEGSWILGDLKIESDASGARSVSGGIYIPRGCEIASEMYSPSIVDERYYQFAPTSCAEGDDGTLTCSFVDPAGIPGAVQIRVELSPEGTDRMRIAASIASATGEGEEPPVACLNEIGRAVFRHESPKQFEHNMFLTAKLDFQRADADLNEHWRLLGGAKMPELLKMQRSWIREKDRKCRPVTTRGSEGEMTEIYRCQTLMTEERLEMLRGLEF